MHAPLDEIYFFVMEDMQTKHVIGTCSINGRTGVPEPLYFYQKKTIDPHSDKVKVPKDIEILQVVNYSNGPSELCGIYITPESRGKGLGQLLSRSRLLFIASFPQRFKRTVMAQMRGIMDIKTNSSPFWGGLASHFINLQFNEVMKLMESDHSFVRDVLPQSPIYIPLLPKYAQKVIEKTYINTRPALRMLLKEGFRLSGEFDVFDAGPLIKGEVNEISTIKDSHLHSIADITTEAVNWNDYLISNELIDFKACIGQLKRQGNNEVIITQAVADALQVKKGDIIRWKK